ncbi:MAG: anaerobic ribonucleoside-triphosphate reductase activating protein [Acidobacteria bacterium]|nr:MAG: anaerobic ribonucleoside-triphosphate reductase activating protein [Acidobacteriota bacterium]RLE23791.1 MAG: anaerobic ribonucleoside-triphosphate reductase activating protein [Acidobacteriota bacterium]
MLHGTSCTATGRTVVPIGGVTPFSTLDCPDSISAVFYFQGCPFRCPYCHNTEFQQVNSPEYPVSDFLDFLWPRKGFLDTVVFSGGEPLMFPEELADLTELALGEGFGVALHTSGFNPEALKRYLERFTVKWVGIDLKAGLKDYPLATGIKKNYFAKAAESIHILNVSGIPFEVRTTIFPSLLEEERLDSLINSARNIGVEKLVWQVYCENGRPDTDIAVFLNKYVRDRKLEGWVRVR